jgi:hypothetical protein
MIGRDAAARHVHSYHDHTGQLLSQTGVCAHCLKAQCGNSVLMPAAIISSLHACQNVVLDGAAVHCTEDPFACDDIH